MKEEKLLKAFRICYYSFFIMLIILFILAFLRVTSYVVCITCGVITIALMVAFIILYGFYSKYDHSTDWRCR